MPGLVVCLRQSATSRSGGAIGLPRWQDRRPRAARKKGWSFVGGDEGAWPDPMAARHATLPGVVRGAGSAPQFAGDVGSYRRMRVDPAEIEVLATFFEDRASQLRDRQHEVSKLATVAPPGTDPVSVQAAAAYGQVATDSQGYLVNYQRLVAVLDSTAAKLRTTAAQTRAEDENAAYGLHRLA